MHTVTATDRSFLNRDLLKSPNFVAGTVLMFLIGGIMSGTLALMPTMLQHLMNYPVMLTGLVTAPRGFGTMVAMFIVGRLIGKVDNRLFILVGLVLTAVSLWQMTGFSLQMGYGPGAGVRAVAGVRARLHLRAAEHAGAVDPAAPPPDPGHRDPRLMRNVGGSIGISILVAQLTDRHADRAFAPGRASAPGQPAGAPAVPAGAVQPDRPEGPRRAQRRGDAAGGDGRLHQRFRADDGAGYRRDAAAAAGAPAGEGAVGSNLRQLLSRFSRMPISPKGGATDDIELAASLIISPPPISTSTPQICDRPQSQPAGPLRHRDQHGDHKEGMTRVGIDLAFTPRLPNQNSCR